MIVTGLTPRNRVSLKNRRFVTKDIPRNLVLIAVLVWQVRTGLLTQSTAVVAVRLVAQLIVLPTLLLRFSSFRWLENQCLGKNQP
ncbi:hypothetical protein [Microseira sp. BLCC-F43]|uniref:hypothetical protein n=1 Tax=Microseira sp. BLCC-F43 TaxID=3153602 RepID=UPI0035BAE1AE